MDVTIRGADVFDGLGRDPRRASVAVRGGRFGPVGRGSGGGTVDGSGLTILPGLIDAHTHVGMVRLSPGDFGRVAPAVIAADIFLNCGLAIDAGFTTLRELGGVDGGVVAAIESGLVRGPRILPSGPMICQTGGHLDFSPAWGAGPPNLRFPGLVDVAQPADGPDEIRRAARQAFVRGATQLKLAGAGGVVSQTDRLEDSQFSLEELSAAVQEARARATYVTVHSHVDVGVTRALEAGVTCFEHGSFLEARTLAALKEQDASLVMTFAVNHLLAEEAPRWGIPQELVPRMDAVRSAASDTARRAVAAGVRLGSGSDLLGPEQAARGIEIALKAEAIGSHAAIVSATRTNAEILGISHEVGTIETGKLADLVGIAGDPLQDPNLFRNPDAIRFVLRAGSVMKDLDGRFPAHD
jgi:imidazolonepropionase-like amidohydrolase